jgi:hypothetical protein
LPTCSTVPAKRSLSRIDKRLESEARDQQTVTLILKKADLWQTATQELGGETRTGARAQQCILERTGVLGPGRTLRPLLLPHTAGQSLRCSITAGSMARRRPSRGEVWAKCKSWCGADFAFHSDPHFVGPLEPHWACAQRAAVPGGSMSYHLCLHYLYVSSLVLGFVEFSTKTASAHVTLPS